MKKITSIVRNLDQLETYITDTSALSSNIFNLTFLPNEFTLGNHQQLLQSFIHKNTPYIRPRIRPRCIGQHSRMLHAQKLWIELFDLHH